MSLLIKLLQIIGLKIIHGKWLLYREREKEQEKRDDRSPIRRVSPRRRTRPIRYMVQVPKITLNA